MIIFEGFRKRIFAGLSISSITIFITFVGQLIAVPVYLNNWGAEIYGEWIIITNIVLSFAYLGLGLQPYVTNLLISKYLKNEIDNGTIIFNSGIQIFTIMGGLGVLILFGLVSLPHIYNSLNVSLIPIYQYRIILIVFGLIAIYGIIGGLLMGIFRVVQKTPRQLFYGFLERIVLLIIPIIAAYRGYSPMIAAVLVGVFFLILSIIEVIDVVRISPFPINLIKASWRVSFSLIGPSLFFFGVSLSTTFLFTLLPIIIAMKINSIAVVIFSTTLMMSNFIRSVINTWLNVISPEITSLSVISEQSDRMINLNRFLIKIISVIVIFSGGLLIIAGLNLLEIWTQGEIELNFYLNIFLAVFLILQSFTLEGTTFGLAINKQHDVFVIQVLFSISTLLLSWFLLDRYGVEGVALALVISQIIVLPLQIKKICDWTKDEYKNFILEIATKWLGLIIYVISSSMIIVRMDSRWVSIIAGGCVFLSFVLFVWLFWFTPIEKKRALAIIKI